MPCVPCTCVQDAGSAAQVGGIHVHCAAAAHPACIHRPAAAALAVPVHCGSLPSKLCLSRLIVIQADQYHQTSHVALDERS